MKVCPCGSKNAYSACCAPFIEGHRLPNTAEQLMRARYTAHTRVEIPFLAATLHPDSRNELDEAELEAWCHSISWQGLVVESRKGGGPNEDKGEVLFRARFRQQGLLMEHREHSYFGKQDERWYFLRGDASVQPVVHATGQGRNAPCSCGSGKKWKKCCGHSGN